MYLHIRNLSLSNLTCYSKAETVPLVLFSCLAEGGRSPEGLSLPEDISQSIVPVANVGNLPQRAPHCHRQPNYIKHKSLVLTDNPSYKRCSSRLLTHTTDYTCRARFCVPIFIAVHCSDCITVYQVCNAPLHHERRNANIHIMKNTMAHCVHQLSSAYAVNDFRPSFANHSPPLASPHV